MVCVCWFLLRNQRNKDDLSTHNIHILFQLYFLAKWLLFKYFKPSLLLLDYVLSINLHLSECFNRPIFFLIFVIFLLLIAILLLAQKKKNSIFCIVHFLDINCMHVRCSRRVSAGVAYMNVTVGILATKVPIHCILDHPTFCWFTCSRMTACIALRGFSSDLLATSRLRWIAKRYWCHRLLLS